MPSGLFQGARQEKANLTSIPLVYFHPDNVITVGDIPGLLTYIPSSKPKEYARSAHLILETEEVHITQKMLQEEANRLGIPAVIEETKSAASTKGKPAFSSKAQLKGGQRKTDLASCQER